MALFRLVALPMTAPIAGLLAVARALERAALSEHCDPAQLRKALDNLENLLETGEISEAEFDEAEEALIERLQEGRRLTSPGGA
ncbi:MAG: gas vesicle protein GvpG [Pseudomonadota bacterium]